MASKLYIQNEISILNPETGQDPAVYLALSTVVDNNPTTLTTATITGPVTIPSASTQGTDQSVPASLLTWYSPLLNAITISGTVTFNLWASVDATASNATITAELYRASKSGTIISTIASATRNRAALTTAAAVQNWTVTPTSTALNKDDRLAVRYFIDDASGHTMVSGHLVAMDVSGNTSGVDGDTWVQVTEAITTSSTLEIPAFDYSIAMDNRRNLVCNPSFETNVTDNTFLENDFSVGGSPVLSQDATTAQSGTHSAKVVLSSSTNLEIWRCKLRMNNTDFISLQTGLQYTVSVYIKTSDSRNIQLAVEEIGGISGYYASAIATTTSWARYSFSFTVTADKDMTFNVLMNTGNAGTVWVDAGMVETSNNILGTYFDGSNGGFWEGTSNNSPSTSDYAFVIPVEVNTINVNNSSTVTDSVTILEKHNINVNDASTVTESIDILRNKTRDITTNDSSTVTNVVTQVLQIDNVNVFDSSTVTNVLTQILQIYTITVNDASTVTEAVIMLERHNMSVSDSSAVTESLTMLEIDNISASDSSTATDVLLQALEIDNISVNDSSTVTEALTILETNNISVFDSSTVTDVLIQDLETLFMSLVDSSTVTENITTLEIDNMLLSDASTVTENITITLPIVNQNLSVFDTSTVTDSLSQILLQEFVLINDASTVTESLTMDVITNISVTDSSSATDVLLQALEIDNIFALDSSTATDVLNGENSGIYLNPIDLILYDRIGSTPKLIFVEGHVAYLIVDMAIPYYTLI